ncbi:hypothetical protein QJQ45_022722, partial [Haematococcus lacustris]
QQQHPVSHEQLLPQAGREGELGGASAAPPPPSFLSLDQDGRVLRVDTLSKVVVWKLLESWGQQGWRQHLAQLHALYARKAAAMAAAAEEHLGGLATWGGGAACCRHVHVAEAAGGVGGGVGEEGGPGELPPPSEQQLSEALVQGRVVGVPGSLFLAAAGPDLELGGNQPCVEGQAAAGGQATFLRLTFALLSEAERLQLVLELVVVRQVVPGSHLGFPPGH